MILEPAVPSEESTEGQINAPPTGNRTKLPNLTGKQRKSNIEVNNPQLEFLKAQLTSLKVALAQKDAEMKKVLESDKLKAQKIIALNAELQEKRNFITKQCNVTPSTEVPETVSQSTYGTENTRVNFLELKTSSLEQQVTMLMTKMDSLQINLLPRPSCNSKKCETCEDTPSDQKAKLPCKKCDFETYEMNELKEHYRSEHPTPILSCGCSVHLFFSTNSATRLTRLDSSGTRLGIL